MKNVSGLLRGGPGRRPGVPNKSTRKVKAFLASVFEEAFARPEMHKALVEQIVTLKIDTSLLATLLAHYAGRPAQAVDHTFEGRLSLAQLIAGPVAASNDAGEQDQVGEDRDD